MKSVQNNGYFFKLLNFGVLCYIAIDNFCYTTTIQAVNTKNQSRAVCSEKQQESTQKW
jgi:hypothetical protein